MRKPNTAQFFLAQRQRFSPVLRPALALGLLMALSLSACSPSNGLLLLPRGDLEATTFSTNPSTSAAGSVATGVSAAGVPMAENTGRLAPRKRVKVSFFTVAETPEGEPRYTPLSTENLVRLTFDGQFALESGALRQEPVLVQSFNFLESGAHVIALRFENPDQDIRIPLVVPEDTERQVEMRVNMAFDAQGNVRDVQVGYDQNGNDRFDNSRPVFRSSDGYAYLAYLPDGQVREWISPLDQVNSETVATGSIEAPLPPGSEKDASSETVQAPVPQTGTENTEPTQVPLPPVDVPPVPVPQPLPLPAPPAS